MRNAGCELGGPIRGPLAEGGGGADRRRAPVDRPSSTASPAHGVLRDRALDRPLLGSFITEPAAMTPSALLLRERYFSAQAPNGFKYGTLGVLFVNVSIGGTLTPYAAPMVADRWGWDIGFMLQTFGWKAALAVSVNAICVAAVFRTYLMQMQRLRRIDQA
jgi:hypothetical protein